jgi:hypothetical protein
MAALFRITPSGNSPNALAKQWHIYTTDHCSVMGGKPEYIFIRLCWVKQLIPKADTLYDLFNILEMMKLQKWKADECLAGIKKKVLIGRSKGAAVKGAGTLMVEMCIWTVTV